MRAVIVSEEMGPPLNEGIRKFATSLVAAFDSYCDTTGLATEAYGRMPNVFYAQGGQLFRGRPLRKAIEQLWPDVIVYVPSASGTLFSFLRARRLKRICPTARLSMVLTQMRKHNAVSQTLISHLAPDGAFCQSPANINYLSRLGIEASFLPSGVDLHAFRPVSRAEKFQLRAKLGLPQDEYLVLHAGHLTRERNAGILAKLEGVGRGVMLAGAAGRDSRLKQALAAQGVFVIDKYIDRVQELYQAVDCYVFPTRDDDAAMEFPLSVLEAMACDLPVVAYPYGGLPTALEPRDGLTFATTDEEMLDAIAASKHAHANTRAQAEQFDWKTIAATILQAAEVRNAGAIVAAV
jgi:glycosyltransferase involved in cell wall biosynthesis